MRRALQPSTQGRQVTVARSVPAPVGGWDTESPLAKMPPQNAVILDNWIPRASYIEMRRGSTQHVTGTADPVEGLIAYRGDADGDHLLACAGPNIYDVTDSGALGAPLWEASASSSSARFKSTNFSNDAGAFAILANGVNTPLRYNGSNVAELAITGTSGSITLTSSTLCDVMTHKRRLFFIQKNSMRVWFLATAAIQGDAGLLDLGPIFNKGGRLVAQGTWSLDGGQGMDDMAVWITSEGQIAIYQGLDPSDANNWSLVGVFDIAKPLGDRCVIKWGGDLVVITEDGVLPLSQALSKNREQAKQIALTAKIATAFATSAKSYGSLFGWCGVTYSGRGSLAIFNIPTAELSTAVQYVQSIETGSWCRFTGLNAICWAEANGGIYFGMSEGVYQADLGSSDNGETITADVKPAFSNFGYMSEKQFTQIRPLLKAPSIIAPALEILTDYREAVPTAVPTVVAPGSVSPSDADAIRYDWTGATSFGRVGTPRMRVQILGETDVDRVSYDGTDLVITEAGGDTLITRPNLPLDVEVQCIGWDLMFTPGGQI
jgi:hypothetical protein